MLQGKTVLLGVTGSIAAYKTASLASTLKKEGCSVHVIMTKNATEFITPLTFETLTGNRCITDTFDRSFEFKVGHVSLGKLADLVLIAPASADVIAKLAAGIADDMLTTTVLAARCPVLVSPAMNTAMYQHPATQANLKKLTAWGYEIIRPATGLLACDDTGIGKMPEPDLLARYVKAHLAKDKDMADTNVLVTAGPTREPLDPVRYITNHSTGKMGYALAQAAMERGAVVTLVSGPTALEPPLHVKTVPVTTSAEMYEAVTEAAPQADIILKAAAVADYTPSHTASEKVKKKEGDLSIPLVRTRDILRTLGEQKHPGQFLCGFSMETKDLLANSTAKLQAKHADMIVANSLRTEGAGFGHDTNVVTLITKAGSETLPKMDKLEVAHAILDRILAMRA
ncbi:MAG: bifunctional phosphopantothenoylcysteine decarboxylase/phosphopantothenate--cysteine ligase CoaBC [Eubacteriales bacterium]|nr:bifunctional phosphopantothenoylcysteine decarboxylase/phosphopantothenate--cysteine ligase CoaBC [Eubacteriales bacterium]